MPARFIFLENGGSPTRWDVTRYFGYLDGIRATLPADLASLTCEERYSLPSDSDLSFWHSEVTQVVANRGSIRVSGRNDSGTRRFDIVYSGVKKFQSTRLKFSAMPWLVMQELVVMPNGLFRHTYSDIGGDFTTVYAEGMTFQDGLLQ